MDEQQPIANETEYADALADLSRTMDLDPDVIPNPSAETVNTQIEALARRIKAYEDINYPGES
jgi:antitoxin component HigA of HigAB toxin-antitoxin module